VTVAILTLADLGLHPESRNPPVNKIDRFNAQSGTPANAGFYSSESGRALHRRHDRRGGNAVAYKTVLRRVEHAMVQRSQIVGFD